MGCRWRKLLRGGLPSFVEERWKVLGILHYHHQSQDFHPNQLPSLHTMCRAVESSILLSEPVRKASVVQVPRTPDNRMPKKPLIDDGTIIKDTPVRMIREQFKTIVTKRRVHTIIGQDTALSIPERVFKSERNKNTGRLPKWKENTEQAICHEASSSTDTHQSSSMASETAIHLSRREG